MITLAFFMKSQLSLPFLLPFSMGINYICSLKINHKMTLPQILTPAIENAIQSLFDITIDKVEFQTTRKDFEGDITMVIFPLLKLVKSNPVELGNKIGNYLVENLAEVSRFNVVSGFLNIVISDEYYLNFFNEIRTNSKFGFVAPSENDKAVMVEYSSPNTNKPLHLGHVRNNLLGV